MKAVVVFLTLTTSLFASEITPDFTEIEPGVFFIRCERNAGECLKNSNYQNWLCNRYTPARRVSLGQPNDPICDYKLGNIPCYCVDNNKIFD